MNVIKVIVDKMPEGCKNCCFCGGDGTTSPVGCRLTWYTIDFGVYECFARPDWCPLTLQRDTKYGKLIDALESDIHALYAIQDLMMEHPILRGHATQMTIINSAITRANKLLKESESE